MLRSEAEGERQGQSIYIPENSLMLCRSLALPQIRFLLNDSVETDDIFEVFSQSVFLHKTGGNSRFGFEMANMLCALPVQAHLLAHAGCTNMLGYVK